MRGDLIHGGIEIPIEELLERDPTLQQVERQESDAEGVVIWFQEIGEVLKMKHPCQGDLETVRTRLEQLQDFCDRYRYDQHAETEPVQSLTSDIRLHIEAGTPLPEDIWSRLGYFGVTE